jgi:tetratricopeptide (TPR) repeat protein
MKNLIEKAESYINSKDFQSALSCYNKLIETSGPLPYFSKRLAFCYRMIKDLDRAIENYNKALELDPDDCVTYWSRGACFNDKAFLNGIGKNERVDNLKKALADYKYSIELEPTSQEAWLALLDIDLWLFKFDDAISHYGECKPFIYSLEYCLIRSWYGCLALTLAGDSIEDDDERLLYDKSIRLKWYHWAVFAMDIFFTELEQMNFDQKKIHRARDIHQKLLSHFDDEPFNPNGQ